jgi:hypothetical protein
VIGVEALTQTPCITLDGQVFERVSSESVCVTDPVRLAALLSRGQQARERAQAQAAQAVRVLQEGDAQQLGVIVTRGLAAASYEDDVGSRLFHSRFRAQLDDAFEDRLFGERSLPRRTPADGDHAIWQSYMERGYSIGEVAWRARARWDGAVGVSATLTGSILKHGSFLDFVLLAGWRLAADLVAALGGYGDARMHLAIEKRAIDQQLGDFYRGLPGLTELTRWADVAEPSGDLVGSVQRELQRAAGSLELRGRTRPTANRGLRRALLRHAPSVAISEHAMRV